MTTHASKFDNPFWLKHGFRAYSKKSKPSSFKKFKLNSSKFHFGSGSILVQASFSMLVQKVELLADGHFDVLEVIMKSLRF